MEENYIEWSPEHHKKFEYIKGNIMEVDSILRIEEELGGMYLKMKFEVIEVISHKKIVLKAKFPASIANLKLIFKIEENDKGVLLFESNEVGFKNPLLGFWNYIIKKLFFNEKLQRVIEEHGKEGLKNLKQIIEKN